MRDWLTRTVIGLAFCVACSAVAQDKDLWTEVDAAQMDVRALTPLAREVLNSPKFKWRHAQTDHFVLHFEHGIFAAKVARMAEFFYSYIAEDLKGAQDRVEGRSHIFIFRTAKAWDVFLKSLYGGGLEWSFSMVQGPVMYLQQADETSSSATVLGHEMTHLVMNRFFAGRLPAWLTEGTAEWYGEFAYAAFKGIKKSKRPQFRDLKKCYPVASLLDAAEYPADPAQVGLFYKTSKYAVAYLQLQKTPEAFVPFLTSVMGGAEVRAALAQHYGIQSAADLERDLMKFAN